MVKNIKLKLIKVILIFSTFTYLNADEPLFIVIEDSPIWHYSDSFPKTTTIIDELNKDSIIYGIRAPILARIDKKLTYMTDIRKDGQKYQIKSSALKPANTKSFFDEKMIFNYDDPDRKVWVVSYYLDIFSKQNREHFFKYEHDYLQYNKEWNEIDDYGAEDWWDEIIIGEKLQFFNSAISIGRIFRDDFWILNIRDIESGYRVAVQGDSDYIKKNKKNKRYDNMQLPLYKNRKTFDLIFIQDGDYMDVYVDSVDLKFATFASVELSFLEEFKKLIRDEDPDISKITYWPQRKDKSMDYLPPHNFQTGRK